jgi:hypothetical protein
MESRARIWIGHNTVFAIFCACNYSRYKFNESPANISDPTGQGSGFHILNGSEPDPLFFNNKSEKTIFAQGTVPNSWFDPKYGSKDFKKD